MTFITSSTPRNVYKISYSLNFICLVRWSVRCIDLYLSWLGTGTSSFRAHRQTTPLHWATCTFWLDMKAAIDRNGSTCPGQIFRIPQEGIADLLSNCGGNIWSCSTPAPTDPTYCLLGEMSGWSPAALTDANVSSRTNYKGEFLNVLLKAAKTKRCKKFIM